MENILKYGHFYHIYSRGIDGGVLFRDAEDYEHFLSLYHRYISPVAETYAWVLMPNHFHLLVKVKEHVGYKYSNSDRSMEPVRFEEHKWETTRLSSRSLQIGTDSVKKPQPHLHFIQLLISYSNYFNKRYGRIGNLFEQPFKRKLISHEKYLKHVILYIHNNPIHHGFCRQLADYPWSSYLSGVSRKPVRAEREFEFNWFDTEDDFRQIHDQKVEIDRIERLLDL
jgi:putative transposase